MTEFGKIDALASLDDNEDPDSEDESSSENSANEKEGEEEEEEKKKATESVDDLLLRVMGMGLSNDSPLLKEDIKTSGQCTEVGPKNVLNLSMHSIVNFFQR